MDAMNTGTTAALHTFLQRWPEASEHEPEIPPSHLHAPQYLLTLYRSALQFAEEALENERLEEEVIELVQALYREQEQWLQRSGPDRRHHIVITIPVADRPQQLARCLQSLVTLCHLYHYGRTAAGTFSKLTVMVADDSLKRENQTEIRNLVNGLQHQGIHSIYFGREAQQQTVAALTPSQRTVLQHAIVPSAQSQPVHNGASITRNLAYLRLNALQRERRDEKYLFWFVDSDQEFRVKVLQDGGERDLYSINYLYLFDQLFTRHRPIMVTGKLVGDPPVSPTVMSNNLLLDLNHLIGQLATLKPNVPCRFHQHHNYREGEAAYHDMTDLFGYPVPQEPYEYRCCIQGAHTHSDTLRHLARQLTAFFFGEHPTRCSFYQHQPPNRSIKSARTVYTANYIFNAEGLTAFIPFASLKLRMAGPILGRFLQQQWGERFLSVNLPMVHKRALNDSAAAEHRPGVMHQPQQSRVDFSAEFERQYYGDVLLFAIERLYHAQSPDDLTDTEQIRETLEQTEEEIRTRYQQQRSEIEHRLNQFEQQWKRQEAWWHHDREIASGLSRFIDNIRFNFLDDEAAWGLIGSPDHRRQRLDEITTAIQQYPLQREMWTSLLSKEPSINIR